MRKSKSDTVATVTGMGDDAEDGLATGSLGSCWKKLSSSIEERLERGPLSCCTGSIEELPPCSSVDPALHAAVLKSNDCPERPLLPGVNTWSGLESVSGLCKLRLSCWEVLEPSTKESWVCSELSCCLIDQASVSLWQRKRVILVIFLLQLGLYT